MMRLLWRPRTVPSLHQTPRHSSVLVNLSIPNSAQRRSILAIKPDRPSVSFRSRLRAPSHVFDVGIELSRSLAWIIVDLVTLVTACALTVDPNGLSSCPDPRMHALIWQQSGGEPWSFSVPGQGWPRVFPTVQDTIRGARASVGGQIRVGLTGLRADGAAAIAEMFAPCPNIAIAASQIAQLAERCRTHWRFKADPIYCALRPIAARGNGPTSWSRTPSRLPS
jgi:hypothetical protein